MKKFYKVLEDFPASFDQTSDNINNMRGLAPQTYRSPEVDEEESKTENIQIKDAIKQIIEGLENRETLDKNGVQKIVSMLKGVLNKIH